MSQMITDGYLTPINYAENQQIFVKVEFYDTELSDWADDGNLIAELLPSSFFFVESSLFQNRIVINISFIQRNFTYYYRYACFYIITISIF